MSEGHCTGTDPRICWTRLYLRKVQCRQTLNKCSIYSWAAAPSHAKERLNPALTCSLQGWCGTRQNLQTLPALTTKRKGVIKPFSRTRAGHDQASHQALHLLSPPSKVFQCKADFWQQKLFLAFFQHAVLFEEWVMFQQPLSRLQCPNGNERSSPPSNEGPSPRSAHI